MKRFQVNLLSCVVVAVLIPLLLTTGIAEAAGWSFVPSPNPGTGNNALISVAVVAANNVWAVGETTDSSGAAQTLFEHWNGTTWSVVASPRGSSGVDNVLRGVTAVSANDVWAIGFRDVSGVLQTLTEHWNGHTWSVVATPNVGTTDNSLFGVTAVSSNDVWAVGFDKASGHEQTLIEHWNGTMWSVVASPSPNSSLNFLFGAAADTRSGQTWAVGDFAGSKFLRTLIEFHA